MTVEKIARGTWAGAAVRPPHRAAAVADSPTLLVADDDLCLLHGVALGFERRGAHVLSASTGLEALRLFHRHREEIDAAVLDLWMPGMDGQDVYAQLRRLDPQLPLLVHSAEYRPAFEMIVAADPRAAFERKPCRFADLVAALTLLRAT